MFRPLLALLLFAGVAHAREASRISNILSPSPDHRSEYQNKTFHGTKAHRATEKSAPVRSFHFADRVQTREFSTRSYQGANPSRFGSRKFETRSARTDTDRAIPNADREVTSKTLSPRNAPEAGRKSDTRDYSGVREARMRGKAQGSLDQQYAPREPLSIDQIREILNRSK